MNQITPSQAIDVLAQVQASYNASGKDHALIAAAIACLAQLVQSTESAKAATVPSPAPALAPVVEMPKPEAPKA